MIERAQRCLLVVCFLVCPLLFFTNLTRNPYVTQISLLNISLALTAALALLGAAARGEAARLPRTAVDLPLAATAALAALSWGAAYIGHPEFFRPSMRAEGLRQGLFLCVNVLIPFYLAATLMRRDALATTPAQESPVGTWVFFALAWGAAWTAFPLMRSGRVPAGIWNQLWDGYGAALWAGGLVWAAWLCRAGRAADYIHLAMTTGFLASVYGACQYFNVEFIWPIILNPYGGRSVSTFGNPNFLSSYNVVLLPIAALQFLSARGGGERIAYGTVLLALEAALLASLTRSSWGGALAGLVLLGLSRECRNKIRENPRPAGLLAGLAVVLVLLWPQSSVEGPYTSTVIGRLTEIQSFSKADGYYSPFHQRLLIWTSAWLMGAENPLTGKGWGLFELFYPFYQGVMLAADPFFRKMRTHANNSHNEIFEVWAQSGLLGVGVLAWLWWAFGRGVAFRWRQASRPLERLSLAAACGAAGMLVDNLLNVSLHFAVPAFMFWWAAGTAAGGSLPEERPWRSPGGAGGAAPLAAAGALAVVLVAWYWTRVWFREVHYFAGFKLLRGGQVAGGIRQLEESQSWGPREVNAIYELGNAYARAERFKDADATYAAALSANAGYDEIYFNIGTIKASRLGQFEEARNYYRMAVLINPLSPEATAGLAALYLRDEASARLRLREAAEFLERAVAIFPDNANHWNNLGFVQSLGGRISQAQDAYARALELNPDLAVSERNLRAVVRQSGRPAPAILEAIDVLRTAEALAARGEFSEKTYAAAAEAARQLPAAPRARFIAGVAALARGRDAEAAEHLAWVAGRDPGNLAVRINLAKALTRLGRRDEAVRQLRAAQAIEPGNQEARMGLEVLGGRP